MERREERTSERIGVETVFDIKCCVDLRLLFVCELLKALPVILTVQLIKAFRRMYTGPGTTAVVFALVLFYKGFAGLNTM